MIDNNIASILKERYRNYHGEYSFDEALKALKQLTVKQNKAEQLYIHHADDCGEEVTIPYGIDFIKAGAFRKQYDLKRVTILAKVIEIPRYTFVTCTALSEIILPDSVLSIGQSAFEDCTSLERVTIPASVQEIKEEAFLGCKALREAELLNPDTKIGKNAFPDGCIVKYGSERHKSSSLDLAVEEEEATIEVIEAVDVEENNTEDNASPGVETEIILPVEEADSEVQAESLSIVTTDDQASQESPVEKPTSEGKHHSMKMLFCADVRLGAICTENLDIKQSHKWKAARSEKLADLIDKAAQNNAAYVALFGRIFGQDRISESVIDGLFAAIKDDQDIQALAFLNAEEYKRISYRNDIPENLHLLCTQTQDSYTDDDIALRIDKGVIVLQLADNDALTIRVDESEKFEIVGMPETYTIPSFEPIGFEDAEGLACGYGVLDWSGESIGQFIVTSDPKYNYQSIELKVLPEDDEKEIVRKINNTVRKIDFDTFLRITITGQSAFGLTISGDGLKAQLQNRIFFVEVYDNTVMDIDEEAFENDISLRSEFVRLALQDDSLSESERNRLISCGWNALNGREVTAE